MVTLLLFTWNTRSALTSPSLMETQVTSYFVYMALPLEELPGVHVSYGLKVGWGPTGRFGGGIGGPTQEHVRILNSSLTGLIESAAIGIYLSIPGFGFGLAPPGYLCKHVAGLTCSRFRSLQK